MEVFLLRHGIAEERRPGRADAKRALTEKGRERLGLVLDLARAAGVSPSLILTSPYVRAVQTAELAAQVLGCERPIVHTNALLPGSSPEKVWEEIRSRREEAAVLLAGHEPLLGQAASFLLGASWGLLEMKKGALVSIDIERFDARPRGLLRWLLPFRLADAGHR
jgi:phosphohistidine phosphatase